MKELIFIFSFIFYIQESFTQNSKACHNRVPSIRNYLGSNTPYRFIGPENQIPHSPGCEVQKMVGFIRHGTRTPSWEIMQRMKEDLPLLKEHIANAISGNNATGLLCESVVMHLLSWQYRVEFELNEKFLTAEGQYEMSELAKRLQYKFPELLLQVYSNNTYFFKFTMSQRAAESAKAFTTSLFGRYESSEINFASDNMKEDVTRFSNRCDKWQKMVKRNPGAALKYWDLIYSDEVTDMCRAISHRLGLNVTLSFEDIDFLYTVCTYETAWNNKVSSPWCSIFSEQDFETLSYASDMHHYWIDGYGHMLNYKIACPAVKEIFNFLDLHPALKGYPKVSLYFVHSGTLLKILAHLGLYKDSFQLSKDLPLEKRGSRLWRTSYINTFGSNLIFVSHLCGTEKKILTLYQERPIHIPGCPTNDFFCPLTRLRKLFRDTIYNCNLGKICELPDRRFRHLED